MERRKLRGERAGAEGVGVLLAESVQKVERHVSRKLLPLPIPFPKNEVERSERMRELGWQGGPTLGCAA